MYESNFLYLNLFLAKFNYKRGISNMDPFIKKFLIGLVTVIVIIVAISIWAGSRQGDKQYSYSQVDSIKTQPAGIR